MQKNEENSFLFRRIIAMKKKMYNIPQSKIAAGWNSYHSITFLQVHHHSPLKALPYICVHMYFEEEIIESYIRKNSTNICFDPSSLNLKSFWQGGDFFQKFLEFVVYA